jgi:cold-inducible RNA-binding protein
LKEAQVATRIYVGNLPYTADSQQVADMFKAYGVVVDATVVIDRATGQSKGFGFVEMTTDDSVQRAITGLNGTTVGDRTLTVNEARPRPDRSATGGYNDRPRRDDFDRERRW